MPLPRPVRTALVLTLALASACTSTSSTANPAPAPAPAPAAPSHAPPLPPVPAVDGPLAINVVYPRENQVVTSRDSNFVFGSIGSGKATLLVNGVPARVYPNGAFILYLATSPADTIAALNARLDTLRASLNAGKPIGLVQIGEPSAAADTDRVINGRPIDGGTYKWFFAPGTVVPLVGREGGFFRVRLDRDLDVFVDSTDARVLTDTAPPRRVMSNLKVRGAPLGEDVVIPIGQRAPYFVEELDR